jgi:hypothetical protein
MVIPEDRSVAGLQIIGAGLVSLGVAAPSLIAAARRRDWSFQMSPMQRVRVVMRFGVSAMSYLAIIVAGILLLSSHDSAFSWLLISTVVLLVVSLRNTWDLLVTVADVTQPDQ